MNPLPSLCKKKKKTWSRLEEEEMVMDRQGDMERSDKVYELKDNIL